MIPRPYQKRLVDRAEAALRKHGDTLSVAATGAGKCLGKGTPVLMFDGSVKSVEDVHVNDLLMGPDSTPRRVVSLARGREELFRVSPTKGDPYVVNRSHILSLKITGAKPVAGHAPGATVNLSVDEYLGSGSNFRHCAKGWRTGVDFPIPAARKGCDIPPYILGAWLGDGSNQHPGAFANPDQEVILELEEFASRIGMKVRHEEVDNKCPMHFITTGTKCPNGNTFSTALRTLGLPGNKHIPFGYKAASRFDRLELLAGLMDTDGHMTHGGYDFITKDEQLAIDTAFLARSLGLAAYVKPAMKRAQTMSEAKLYHRVSVSGDCSVIPCRIPRKQAPSRKQKKDALRVGLTLEPIGMGDYFGFEIEGPDRLFLLGDFTVTHNTIMLAMLGGRIGGRQLVLQHRQELVSQNLTKYRKVNPCARPSLYTADTKSMRGDVVFAMAQTLSRNLDRIPSLDLLILDEAHHAAAPTWRAIVEAARAANPGVLVAGFTATPERGDSRSLRGVFSNVADVITIRELVQLGFLVPPKAFVVDVGGTQEALRDIGQVSDYFDQAAVEAILNTVAVNDEVVRHWREKAGDRQTIVFASTVQHAQDVASAFLAAGVRAACVHGAMPDAERRAILSRFDKGQVQVLCNVMVLTEGFDSQPVACVVLLRKCSEKGPLVQMVGRGLRTVDPELFPGVIKKDCVVLDFGTSLLTHGDLNMVAALKEDVEREKEEAATKICPMDGSDTYRWPDAAGRTGCGAELPVQTRTCPLCGFQFERLGADEGSTVTSVELTEMDILDASPFRYIDLYGSGRAMMAAGFTAWAGVFSPDAETWHALGKVNGNGGVHRLAAGERLPCLAAADDFLRLHETDGATKKTKRWLSEPATPKQIEYLKTFGYEIPVDVLGNSPMTKYAASCHMDFQWSLGSIERALGVAA